MLEVRWRYRHKVTGKPIYIWCTGEVLQVADGGTTKKSQRCKNVLPLGAVRIKWPADVSSLTKTSHSCGRSSGQPASTRTCIWAGASTPKS
mmetsp:Transcript_84439/g.168622  ORF Transcript_84439/g.168622 Transcript_84439/m.168622 type:complete len:91 (-) Transcript_84439:169-441(-)